MYSKYVNNIRLREEPREPIVGGVPLPMFLNLSSETMGGSNQPEGLSKISHLSIPVGLVITSHNTKSSYMVPYQTKIVKISTEDNDTNDMLDEHLFNKLYNQTAYKTTTTTTKKRKTRRKSSS